jgi:hypothetical protein
VKATSWESTRPHLNKRITVRRHAQQGFSNVQFEGIKTPEDKGGERREVVLSGVLPQRELIRQIHTSDRALAPVHAELSPISGRDGRIFVGRKRRVGTRPAVQAARRTSTGGVRSGLRKRTAKGASIGPSPRRPRGGERACLVRDVPRNISADAALFNDACGLARGHADADRRERPLLCR